MSANSGGYLMRDGGARRGVLRLRRGRQLAMTVLGLTVLLISVPLFGAMPAGAVSTRVPTVQPGGALVYGKAPVRPEVTRSVVATPAVGAQPLSLLFRIASGQPATPTQVLTQAPPAATPPAVVSAPDPFAAGLPPLGKAWVWGCAAALAYLKAYAAPNFSIACPGNAGGHQATTTCISGYGLCSLGASIVIADPCPAAYMNEASNSWMLLGLWHVPLDPFGSCP